MKIVPQRKALDADKSGRQDWNATNLSPDVRGVQLTEQWAHVRDTLWSAYGLTPVLFNPTAQSAVIREALRFITLWSLQPIADGVSEEFQTKLEDDSYKVDLVGALQAADSAGRARAVGVLVGSGMELAAALKLVGWSDRS